MKLQSKSWLSKNRMQLKYLSIGLFIFLILFTGKSVSAQNLISNSDFEFYTGCPDSNHPNEGIELASPWSSITNGSVDYFNACSDLSSVPWRGHDYQLALSGVGYAALWMFSPDVPNVREYLQAPLVSPLQSDKYYHVTLFVNACNLSQIFVNNFGVHFSGEALTIPGPLYSQYLLEAEMQIYNFGNPVISDTLNWTKISGIYLASGGESFITMGNFKDDASTQTQGNEDTLAMPFSYYFIEDVSVEEINQPFWQYHDTTVYYGDSVLIGPALTGLDIDWYTDNLDFISNAPGIYVTPPTSRDYIAKETFDGVETEHVVHVTVIGGAGLEENELQNVRVFPNPSKGSFSISGIASDKPLRLEVRDVHGKLVFEENGVSKELNSFALDVENGIYFVTVECGLKNRKMVEKIVLMR
jgi:hypothetical protein